MMCYPAVLRGLWNDQNTIRDGRVQRSPEQSYSYELIIGFVILGIVAVAWILIILIECFFHSQRKENPY